MKALLHSTSDRGSPKGRGRSEIGPYLEQSSRGARLWWLVIAAFAVQLAVWTGWLIFAAHHRVEDVPLATPGGR